MWRRVWGLCVSNPSDPLGVGEVAPLARERASQRRNRNATAGEEGQSQGRGGEDCCGESTDASSSLEERTDRGRTSRKRRREAEKRERRGGRRGTEREAENGERGREEDQLSGETEAAEVTI